MKTVIKQIKAEIKEIDKSIVVFVMSHGKDGAIHTSDRLIYYHNDIFAEFNESNCPQLKEKPKVFFIVACLGKEDNCG